MIKSGVLIMSASSAWYRHVQSCKSSVCGIRVKCDASLGGLLGLKQSLWQLGLSGAAVGHDAVEVLAQLTGLSSLHLHTTILTRTDLQGLTTLPGLHELQLTSNNMRDRLWRPQHGMQLLLKSSKQVSLCCSAHMFQWLLL